jgi:RNA polymerase sigma factor (sigma-70 family)
VESTLARVELLGISGHQPYVTDDFETSDDALWEASSRGDGRAFSEIYERHARAIYNYLFRRLADWSEAEDLTAVVFLEAFRRRKEVVVDEGKLLPWLYGIATNVLRNRRRAQFRHRRLLARLDARPHAAEPDAAARAEAVTRMRSVLEGVAALPRQQQDVVALCVWSGLDYAEAAVALGIPVGTVRSRLARARAALTELDSAPRHGEVEMELERTAER